MSCGASLAAVFGVFMTAAVVFYAGLMWGERRK